MPSRLIVCPEWASGRAVRWIRALSERVQKKSLLLPAVCFCAGHTAVLCLNNQGEQKRTDGPIQGQIAQEEAANNDQFTTGGVI